MKIKVKKISKKIVFLFVSTIIATSFFASTSLAYTNGSFTAKPASSDENWFTYELAPGDSVKDSIKIMNNKETSQTFYVYPADTTKSTGGGFAIKQRKEEMNDIGSWIEIGISGDEITLPPKSSRTINFTLTVPNDDKLDAGEHAGGIAVEEKPNENLPKKEGINIHTRIGIRVYVTLPGEIIKNIEYKSFAKNISGFRSFIIPRTYQFLVTFNNTGNVSNTVEMTFSAKNLISRKVETQKYTQLLTRDTEGTNTFNWKAPFFGIYKFKVEGIYQTIDGTKSFNTKSFFGIIIPWDLVVIIVAICVFAWKRYKKYKDMYSGKDCTKYKVKKQDTLESLAKRHSTTWKFIAKVNKIKAPFSIKEGQTVLVPKPTTKRKTKSQK